MSENTTTTSALAQALAEAGIDMPIHEVDALVRGVAAAAVQDRDWLRLIHPEADAGAAVAERLEALRRTYAEAPDGIDIPQQESRLAALRAELARRSLDGFVVPLSDEHQGEYVARRSQRLAWLTGFTGSAGMAIVLAEQAALFIDGRYTLQAAAQVDGSLYEHRHITEEPPTRGSGSISRKAPRSATTPGFMAQAKEIGCRRHAAPRRPPGAMRGQSHRRVVGGSAAGPARPHSPHPARFAGAEAGEKREIVAAGLRRRAQRPRC